MSKQEENEQEILPRSQNSRVFWIGSVFFLLLFSGFIYHLVQRENTLSYVLTQSRFFITQAQDIALDTLIYENPNDINFSSRYVQLTEKLEQFNRELFELTLSNQVTQAPIELVEDYLNQLHKLYALDLSIWYAVKRFDSAINSLDVNLASAEDKQSLENLFKDYISTASLRERRFLEQWIIDVQNIPDKRGLAIPVTIIAEVMSQLDAYHSLRNQLIALDYLEQFASWLEKYDQQYQHISVQLIASVAFMLIFCFGFVVFGQFVRNNRLVELSEQANHLAKAKSEFLANMSHEIRTPLNAMIGFSSLLAQSQLAPRQRDYLNKIRSSSDSLLLLINDILDLTKVESGKLDLEEVEFDLDGQLDVLASMFSELVKDKELEIVIHKDRQVPDYLRGDPLRLGQVLINLVSNAVKFTERGQIEVELKRVSDDPLRIAFLVKDTGIGIAKERIDELFGAFVQFDASTTRRYGGTGLGLNISRHLVRLMGGDIKVHSQVGEGSVFQFELPLKTGLTELREERLFLHEPLRILLFESNPLVEKIVCDILKGCGAIVYSARTLSEVHLIMEEQGLLLQLFIIDFSLSEANAEFLKEIAESEFWRRVAVLVTLKNASYENIKYLDELGIQDYLSKPLTERTLLRKIDEIINGDSLSEAHTALVDAEESNRYQERLTGIHVLLAEDNLVNQQLIVEYLKQLNAVIEIADNGRMAVQLVSEHCFDLMLIDIHMPVMDGLDAIRQIRKMHQSHDTPILVLTASAMREERERCFTAGANGFVTKPVSKIELYHNMLTVLGRSYEKKNNHAHNQPQELALIDIDEVLERLDQDTNALCVLLRLFIQEHQNLAQSVQLACAQKQLTELGELVHDLKGSAANISAKALYQQCREIEKKLKYQELPDESTIENLVELLKRTTVFSEDYLLNHKNRTGISPPTP